MAIKDTIVRWYAQNVLIPKMEEINHPGYILSNVSDAGNKISLREIALPEIIFINLENQIIEKYGDAGKQVLYSVGKKYGYSYATLSNLKKFSQSQSEKDFNDFIYYFVMYVSCIFASGSKLSVDVKTKKFEVDFKDYVVCRINGLGYLLTIGGSAGIWNYMLDDVTLEGAQPKCCGRGDDSCNIIVAPKEYLERIHAEYFQETNLPTVSYSSTYCDMNQLYNTQYSNTSLEEMIDNKVFSYENGRLVCLNDRYLICESSLMYYLETEIKSLKDGEKILLDICTKYGKEVGEKLSDKLECTSFISNFLSSLGFGDTLLIEENGKIKILITHFPWCEHEVDIPFNLVAGIISGLISGFKKNEVKLKLLETSMLQGYLEVIFSE